jgi:hypothetical protein
LEGNKDFLVSLLDDFGGGLVEVRPPTGRANGGSLSLRQRSKDQT